MDALTVATAALDALNCGAWRDVAELVDAQELQTWYSQHVSVPDQPVHRLTPEELQRHEPGMPDEVARWQAAQFNKRASDSRDSLHGQFAGIDTKAELAALHLVDAFACWLQAQDPAWQMEQSIALLAPERRALARTGTVQRLRTPLGVVHEGSERAYVVYRVRWASAAEMDADVVTADDNSDAADGGIGVASLLRCADGWRLRIAGELFESGGFAVVADCVAEDEE